MKPLVQTAKLIDDEEIETFNTYLNLPQKILKLGTLDYHAYIEKHNENGPMFKTDKWTAFTKPTYTKDDYTEF